MTEGNVLSGPLRSKIQTPFLRPRLVVRNRLMERLDRGLASGCRLTLIAAPAGFGKTTLVAAWLAQSERPVAWVSLDETENDLLQFLGYLIVALRQVNAHFGEALEQVIHSPQLPPVHDLIMAFVNEAASIEQEFLVVLDDYHVITAQEVHDLVQFLLDHPPAGMHLIITSRTEPSLALPRLRARGQVNDVQQRDLRFSSEETQTFFTQTMSLALPADAAQALETHTEGWAAGLQLAALALRDTSEVNTFIAQLSGRDSYITDYLLAEVLQKQPANVREFLMRTSILEGLNASLCDAVTEGQNSQAMLEQLEAANLFIVPLDRKREWYRYQKLFAEAVQVELDKDEKILLHAKAARWYETQGLLRSAMHHALEGARASNDFTEFKRLMPTAAEEMWQSGAVSTARAWLNALPEAELRSSGELSILQAWVMALSGEASQALVFADAAEQALQATGGLPSVHGKLLAFRAFTAVLYDNDANTARELASSAMRLLSDKQARWRDVALWVMAEAQERSVNISEAIRTLREAQRLRDPAQNQLFSSNLDLFLASALFDNGQRLEAIQVCKEAIARFTDLEGRVSPLATSMVSRLGLYLCEENLLDQALQCVREGLELGGRLGIQGQLPVAYSALAHVLAARSEDQAALEALDEAYRLALKTALSDPQVHSAMKANIHLKQGNLPAARQWVEDAELSLEERPNHLRIDVQIVFARLLLAQGRSNEAQGFLQNLEQFMLERGQVRRRITVHLLQALTGAQLGEVQAARGFVAQAVQLAAPQTYYRTFLDEDERVLSLVRDVRHLAPGFVDKLFAHAKISQPTQIIPEHPNVSDSIPADMLESLSDRELEVLKLVAAGFGNKEIAGKLEISPGTVKRHVINVYGKLGVHSRTQAIARARALKYL